MVWGGKIRRACQEIEEDGLVVKRQTMKGFTYQVKEFIPFSSKKARPTEAFKRWSGMY